MAKIEVRLSEANVPAGCVDCRWRYGTVMPDKKRICVMVQEPPAGECARKRQQTSDEQTICTTCEWHLSDTRCVAQRTPMDGHCDSHRLRRRSQRVVPLMPPRRKV